MLIRSDRLPTEIRLAAALISSTGRRARPASSHPPPKPSASTPAPASASNPASRRIPSKSARIERPASTQSPISVKCHASRCHSRIRARIRVSPSDRSGNASSGGAFVERFSNTPLRDQIE